MTPIDQSLARRLTAANFPQWADLSITPVEPQGHDNRTFRLGRSMSLRLPSSEAYAAHIGVEYEWLPRLAPHLPVAVPLPLGMGEPSEEFPWPWLVNSWIQGVSSEQAEISDLVRYAQDIASFLTALHAIDTRGGPEPSAANFYRGGNLQVYADEAFGCTRRMLHGDSLESACEVFLAALGAPFAQEPVWVHGDMVANNTIISEDRLCGVIDFGQLAVGDPACDLTIAWTFLAGEARSVFKESVGVNEDTWRRARGWALWKALLEFEAHRGKDAIGAEQAARIVDSVLADAKAARRPR